MTKRSSTLIEAIAKAMHGMQDIEFTHKCCKLSLSKNDDVIQVSFLIPTIDSLSIKYVKACDIACPMSAGTIGIARMIEIKYNSEKDSFAKQCMEMLKDLHQKATLIQVNVACIESLMKGK